MPLLKVRFWGVRGSIPAPEADKMQVGGNTPCVVLQFDEEPPVIIDAGTGLRLYGESLGLDANAPFQATLLLSHFHWDHIQGFPFFGPVYSPQTKLLVVSGFLPSVLRRNLGREMTEPYFPLEFKSLPAAIEYRRPNGNGLQIGSLHIRTVHLNHPGRAMGFAIHSPAGSVIYVSDHEHGNEEVDSQIQATAQGADVLIYDAHFTPEEYRSFVGWGHSTWLAGTALAARAEVKRLLLFHHSPDRRDDEIDHILEQARLRFAGTDVATEHTELVLEVPKSSS